MQLIIDTEPTLDIQGDMSTVEGSLDEKFMVNGECDIHLKNTECNAEHEELKGRNNINGNKEIVNVNNDSHGDNDLRSTLDGDEEVVLDNEEIKAKSGLDNFQSSCAKDVNNDEQQMHKDVINNDLPLEDLELRENKSENKVQVSAIEDDINSKNDSIDVKPESVDVTDTENIVHEIDKIESSVKDSSLIKEKEIDLNSEITATASQPSESTESDIDPDQNITKQYILNEFTTCDDTISTEEKSQPIEINMNTDVEGSKSISVEEESPNDITEIPKLNKELDDSVPIEIKDEMDVEEIEDVIEQLNDITNDTDLNKEVPIASKETIGTTTDVGQDQNTDACNEAEIKNGPETIEVKDEVDNDDLKNVEEPKIAICDISLNNDFEQSTSKEVEGDEVMCITDDPKNDANVEKDIENKETSTPIELKDEIDIEEIKDVKENKTEINIPSTSPVPAVSVDIPKKPVICKLSNTLDILSDDEEELPKETPANVDSHNTEKETPQQQSINIEDDDDIMLIDEDIPTESEVNKTMESKNNEHAQKSDFKTDQETGEECNKAFDELLSNSKEKESTLPSDTIIDTNKDVDIKEKTIEKETEVFKQEKPLLPDNFLKSAKKNLADMTREDLEEFCILKIVESIVDRSSLSDIKTKLKTMAQNIDVYRKKAMMLTKQNRDLQVVLKSVQEEQKKRTDLPITPLKINRSVGMQVLMTDKVSARRKTSTPVQTNNNSNNKQNVRIAAQSPRTPKPTTSNQNIPVPRLVPANNPAIKSPTPMPPTQPTNTPGKLTLPNGIKNQALQKAPEKRPHNRIQSVTVDLTDDEPPAKLNARSSPAPPVRLVPPQNLLAPQRQPFTPVVNSPRKVYIPISGPQSQAIRPGQTIMLKPVPGIRPRCAPPQVPRTTNPVRRVTSGRHPAPLPDIMKQYQPPNWKALPPAPDLRLSKVENGIVISWKIEGYQEDSYEEIASYQLYAYQETTSPPSTSLWKKIGDVKALPLPMACTLTQFMAGFKYYFAVRAVDVKSRLGPFSLPGSILLLNKL